MRRTLAAAALALSCSAAPDSHAPRSASDELRAKLAAAEDDTLRGLVRDELAKVELERARQANTIFAYRRFLAEFPGGEEATVARSLLESLRFDEAAKAGTTAAWESFLEEHPKGRRTAEARARLGELDIGAALASQDLSLVRRTLARFPEHDRRAALLAHEDRLAFEAARASGSIEPLEAYLLAHPAGAHRVEAAVLRQSLDDAAVLASEDLARARARASAPGAPPETRATLAKLELALAARALDLETLQRLAGAPDEAPGRDARDAARAMLSSLERAPLSEAVRAAVQSARPGSGLRPRRTLAEATRAGDPQERADALRELAEWLHPDDIPVALDALDSRYVDVRLAALEALRTWAKHLPKAVWDAQAHAREHEALSLALSAGPWRRVAALRDASGRSAEASAAWREVVRDDPSDLAAHASLLALEREAGDGLAFGSAARDLAKAASSFGDERWLQPQAANVPAEERRDGPGEIVGVRAEISLLRQLCAALTLGDAARAALAGLRTSAAATEQQFLGFTIGELERVLARFQTKRAELEHEARARDASFAACGTDRASGRIQASRAARMEAVRALGTAGDRRVLAFVESLRFSPSAEVRAAALDAAKALEAAPAEPPARAAPAPALAPAPKKGARGRR